MDRRTVTILYTNHREETRTRRIQPIALWFGSTRWHPTPQWLLKAFDLKESNYVMKDFAMSGISQWSPVNERDEEDEWNERDQQEEDF